MLAITILIFAYCIGSFPTGLIIARSQGVDITKIGSGNVGATNIARNIGKKAGAITLGIDLLKGFLPVFLISMHPEYAKLASSVAIMTVLGHCFSIPKILKGGKGVATGLGTILAINPILGLLALGVFLIVFKIAKIVSLASLIAVIALPLITLVIMKDWNLSTHILIISMIIILKHRENIQRLLEGKEQKFQSKS